MRKRHGVARYLSTSPSEPDVERASDEKAPQGAQGESQVHGCARVSSRVAVVPSGAVIGTASGLAGYSTTDRKELRSSVYVTYSLVRYIRYGYRKDVGATPPPHASLASAGSGSRCLFSGDCYAFIRPDPPLALRLAVARASDPRFCVAWRNHSPIYRPPARI